MGRILIQYGNLPVTYKHDFVEIEKLEYHLVFIDSEGSYKKVIFETYTDAFLGKPDATNYYLIFLVVRGKNAKDEINLDIKYISKSHSELLLLNDITYSFGNKSFYKIQFTDLDVFIRKDDKEKEVFASYYSRSKKGSEYFELIPQFDEIFFEMLFIFKAISSYSELINTSDKLEDYLLKDKNEYEELIADLDERYNDSDLQ